MCLEMDFKSRYSTQRTLAMQKLAFPMSHMPRIDLGWLCSLANSHIPELLREQLLKLHIPCERAISAFSARRFVCQNRHRVLHPVPKYEVPRVEKAN